MWRDNDVARRRAARWCLDFLDALERFVTRNGRFEATMRSAQLGDIIAVLDETRSFYQCD